ncbi:TetR/AcrR family transcriptional regulator [Sinomonas sp. ASV486]|uniref:TetR/AcrR family transcriptional regulator n=1 Tax=Sinomonas sp. ASV486 TaxID=3051170 RepID=UPI0027DAB773|nr:TetR/AcrR family transcriptional regulator [Sinomonas sp. ASV486]MDQ4491729.1 TetR/AcrR family transcriptional regulator [Sinomonas sp. ASV486]
MNSEAGTRPYAMGKRAEAAAATAGRIAEAALELFIERPLSQLTLALVADRAGVTVQTVLRHCGDWDGVLAAAGERAAARVRTLRDRAPVGDLPGAIANLAEHYEADAPLALRMLSEEPNSEYIADRTRMARDIHRAWCERVFAPYLEGLSDPGRTRRLAQFVAVCDVYVYKLLRHDAGLSLEAYIDSLLELLEPLVRRP